MAKLTFGTDEFRWESKFGTMLKAKADSSIFFFITNRKKTSYTLLGSVREVDGIFPESCYEEQLNKNDTIYYPKDTLINSLACKKVSINCIRSYMNEQNKIVPLDTIWHTYYVATQIQMSTPMSFTTEKLKGLIVKYVEDRTQYSAVKGSIKKSLSKTEVLSSIKKNVKVPAAYFSLPRDSYFYKTVEDMFERIHELR